MSYLAEAPDVHVCFITRKWTPSIGGMETYSVALSQALEDYVSIERIILPGRQDGASQTGWPLIRFGLRTAVSLLFARRIAPIVHVADMASWPLAAIARLKQPSGTRVLSAHGTDVSYPIRKGMLAWLYKKYLQVGAKWLGQVTVLANSQETAGYCRNYGFSDVQVIPLASDVPEQTVEKTSQSVLFAGRLTRLKGCSWFIKNVLPHLPEQVTLNVAGTMIEAEEAEALHHPRVTYLGALDQTDLWHACAEALCVVMPNVKMDNGQFEGFGLLAVEAAAAGGVLLASRHGGLVDAVLDGETGFLLEERDAAVWIEKITEIANWPPQKRAAFTKVAETRSRTYFNWDRVAQDTVRCYGLSLSDD